MKSQTQDEKSKSSSDSSTLIFIDECFDPRSKIGVGCKLILKSEEVENCKFVDSKSLSIETENFDETSASRLELQTLIWALDSLNLKRNSSLILFSKSKTPISLLERRPKLEKTNFMSVRPGMQLTNADLFQDFFKLQDRCKLEIVCFDEKTAKSKDEKLQLMLAEVVKCSDRKLKDRLKSQNQVASKWF